MFYHYIGAEVQLLNKDGIKNMVRVHQRLRNADGNIENAGKYRAVRLGIPR